MKRKLLVGLSLTLFIVATLFIAFPAESQFVGKIKIGIIGPMPWIQGRGMMQGAKLAAKQINAAGGIKVNFRAPGWTYDPNRAYEVEIVVADTLRGMPDPTPATGTAAALELVAAGVDLVIGFFRTEAALGGREVLADATIPLIIAGAATNALIDCAGYPVAGTGKALRCGTCVRDNYARYKYQFRATPQNSTCLFYNILYYLKYVMSAKLFPLYGTPLKVAVISEDLTWADVMHYNLYTVGNYIWNTVMFGAPMYPDPAAKVRLVYGARVSPVATDISAELLAAKAAGAKLVIHVLSGPVGRTCAIQSYDLGIPGILSGIDVPGQEIPLHWEATAGKCETESFLAAAGTRTTVTPTFIAYWDAMIAEYGEAPIYTSGGVYDGIRGFKEIVEAVNKWPYDSAAERIPYMETTLRVADRPDVLSPFTRGPAMMGTFRYTTPALVNVSVTPGVTTWQVAPFLGAADSDPTVAWNNFKAAYAATWSNATANALTVNPNLMGMLHELYMSLGAYSPDWASPFYARSQVTQWQKDPITGEGRAEVFFPRNMPYSKKFKIPSRMYVAADFDIFSAAGVPEGLVDTWDLGAVATAWLCKPGDLGWNANSYGGLNADINSNNFINVADLSAVAKWFGYNASQPIGYYDPITYPGWTTYGQWPLP